jgi:hypothetical protein
MTNMRKLSAAGGILVFALGFCQPSFAVSGCNNGYLSGTYNAQVSSAAFSSVISTLNNSAGLTFGLTPNATAGATTGSVGGTVGGLVGNGASLNGNIPSLGRYFFDGNGGIVGLANYVPLTRSQVGTYSVNNDCTVNIKLSSGQTYGGVLVSQGQQVLFIESDVSGAGTTGTLSKSINYCVAPTGPQSFGFSYFGADAVLATPASGTAAAANSLLTFQPYAAVGSVTLDGAGNFTMTAFSTTARGVQLQNSHGAYTMRSDCSLQLTFATDFSADGASTGAFLPPLGFSGLLSDNGNGAAGVLSVQNWQGGNATGLVIPQ